MKSVEEYVYNEEGKLEKRIGYGYTDGELSLYSVLEYDENEVIRKGTLSYEDGSSYVSEYDSKGQLIKGTSYDVDGNVSNWGEFKYNEAGKQIEAKYYDAEGSVTSWIEYSYESDENGTIVTANTYDAEGNILYWNAKQYDLLNRLLKQTEYSGSGIISYWSEYEYEGDNRSYKKFTVYNADGSVRVQIIN